MKCGSPTCIWPEAIKEIDGPIVLAQIRSGVPNTNITPFKFCPWCGLTLVEDSPESKGHEVKL